LNHLLEILIIWDWRLS